MRMTIMVDGTGVAQSGFKQYLGITHPLGALTEALSSRVAVGTLALTFRKEIGVSQGVSVIAIPNPSLGIRSRRDRRGDTEYFFDLFGLDRHISMSGCHYRKRSKSTPERCVTYTSSLQQRGRERWRCSELHPFSLFLGSNSERSLMPTTVTGGWARSGLSSRTWQGSGKVCCSPRRGRYSGR